MFSYYPVVPREEITLKGFWNRWKMDFACIVFIFFVIWNKWWKNERIKHYSFGKVRYKMPQWILPTTSIYKFMGEICLFFVIKFFR